MLNVNNNICGKPLKVTADSQWEFSDVPLVGVSGAQRLDKRHTCLDEFRISRFGDVSPNRAKEIVSDLLRSKGYESLFIGYVEVYQIGATFAIWSTKRE